MAALHFVALAIAACSTTGTDQPTVTNVSAGGGASASDQVPGSDVSVLPPTAPRPARDQPTATAGRSTSDDPVVPTTTTLPPTTTTTTLPPTTTTTTLRRLRTDVLFDTDSSVLKPEAHDELVEFAGDIPRDARLRFVGHTDACGSEAHNQELSESRAEAIRAWFVEFGFDPALMTAEGLGESEVEDPNERDPDGTCRESGRDHRRVDVFVSYQ